MDRGSQDRKTVVFMSADIADSTTFKQRLQSPSGQPEWLKPYEAFFRELPLVLIGRLATAFDASPRIPEIGVWKVIGDEIIFSALPRDATEAARIVEAFERAVTSYDQRLDGRFGLRIRGCCWAAPFPGSNIEIEIPEMATSGPRGREHYLECIGPDIDAGFRIAKFARKGKVLVSLNLVRAIAGLDAGAGPVFRRLGRERLKGMFDGQPYPLIEVSFGDDPADEPAVIGAQDVVDLADAFGAAQPGRLDPLFEAEA